MAAKKKQKKHVVKKKSVWSQKINPFLAWSLIAVVALFGFFSLKSNSDESLMQGNVEEEAQRIVSGGNLP